MRIPISEVRRAGAAASASAGVGSLTKRERKMNPEYWLKHDKNISRFYIYVLKCENGKYYVGQTKNLEKRSREHLNRKVRFLKDNPPIKYIYVETVSSRGDALKRETDLRRQYNQLLED